MKVYLQDQPESQGESFEIFVKSLSGKAATLKVYENTTIAEIKEML